MRRSKKKKHISDAGMVVFLCEEIIQKVSRRHLGRDLTPEELKHLTEVIDGRFCCETLLDVASREVLTGDTSYIKEHTFFQMMMKMDAC